MLDSTENNKIQRTFQDFKVIFQYFYGIFNFQGLFQENPLYPRSFKPVQTLSKYILDNLNFTVTNWMILIELGFKSQSTIFQSCWDSEKYT